MTGGLIDNQQGGFRAGRGCVHQISILKQISEKAREKKHSVCGFHRFGGVLMIGLNREALWQVLRMYDVGVNF